MNKKFILIVDPRKQELTFISRLFQETSSAILISADSLAAAEKILNVLVFDVVLFIHYHGDDQQMGVISNLRKLNPASPFLMFSNSSIFHCNPNDRVANMEVIFEHSYAKLLLSLKRILKKSS